MMLSIIVPVFNVEDFLPKCLDSLLCQDLVVDEYEVIIVNDGSTDSSLDIAISYANRHKVFRVINQPNIGLGGARNTGIYNSNGDYILFVDSDDYLENNCLKQLIEYSKRQNIDLLRFNYEIISVDGSLIPKRRNALHNVKYSDKVVDGKIFITDYLGWSCYAWLYLYKRDFLIDNNFLFQEQIYYEDVLWLLQIMQKAKRVCSIDIKVYNYFQRQGSITKSISFEKMIKNINDKLLVLSFIINYRDCSENKQLFKWYNGFIALQIMGLLRYTAVNLPDSKEVLLDYIYSNKLSPFRGYRFTLKQNRDLFLINISPRFYMNLRGK